MRCPTKHGTFQCDREAGHVDEKGRPTECETTEKSSRAVAVDFDAQRELIRAAARIEVLRKALEEIKTTPCSDEKNGASCLCCLHDRMFASNALKVLE